MSTIAGFFLGEDPAVMISVAPAEQATAGKEFPAIIDTGYTGFLQMPLEAGHALGLGPFGTTDQETADGSVHPVPLAWGRVTLGSATRDAFIHLQGVEVLIGLDFLRSFNKALFVSLHEEKVLIVDSIDDL